MSSGVGGCAIAYRPYQSTNPDGRLCRWGGQNKLAGVEGYEADQFYFNFAGGGIGIQVDLNDGEIIGGIEGVAYLVGSGEGGHFLEGQRAATGETSCKSSTSPVASTLSPTFRPPIV
jgi:hypothetical protein